MQADEYLARLIADLHYTMPDWDISVGTPEYKILEAVATQLESTSIDSAVLASNFSIDRKSGLELDAFVELFGFNRLLSKRATGTVTFSRGTPADIDYQIPFGTQVYAPASLTSPEIYYATTVSAILPKDQTQVEVPVEAIVGGASGNVPSISISNIAANINGVNTVTNENGFTGGRDQESDAALRARWKATVLRNISGTEDQFLAMALADQAVNRARVVGADERYVEQLQFTGGSLSVTSAVPDAAYDYAPGSEFMGYGLGSSREEIGIRNVHYTYTQATAAPFKPTITLIDPAGRSKFPDNAVIDFEHSYTPKASRNNPAAGVVDKVDIFVTGEAAASILEETVMTTAVFDTTVGSALNRTNWIREDGTTSPASGNRFMKLFKQPLVSLPSTIVVGATTYTKNVHYWLIRDVTVNRGSTRAADGIEWNVTSGPAAGAIIAVNYFYNALVERINEQINLVRLVGIDTLVHKAKYNWLRFNLAVILKAGTQVESAQDDINNVLSDWLESKDFNSNVQIADLYDVINSVIWVDNVRILAAAEARDEVQTITITATGGTYTITFDGITTAALAYNAAALTINTELDSKFGAGQIVASGTGATRVLTFSGSKYSKKNRALVTLGTTALTGGTATVAETTAGIGHGIQSIAEDGENILTTYTTDIYFDTDTIPVLNDVQILVRGYNSF